MPARSGGGPGAGPERGRFLVFEGLDGAGSTTQMGLIGDWFHALGIPTVLTAEPSPTAIGEHIRHVLRSEPWADDVSWAEHMALLFSADRAQHLFSPGPGIQAALQRADWVLCDRYLVSSLAYQTSPDVPAEWVLAINRPALRARPDVTVYVDTPVAVCLERIAHRQAGPGRPAHDDVFHDERRLVGIAAKYSEFLAQTDVTGHLIAVDGSQPIDQVCRSIKEALLDWSRAVGAGLPSG